MEKSQWEEIYGKKIRTDTYIFLERMSNGEKYEDIREDIDQNREKYGVKSTIYLTKKETFIKRLEQAGIKVNNEGIVKKERKSCVPLEQKNSGIYGIYVGDKLIYIGKTTVNFRTRFLQHKNSVLRGEDSKLYNYLRKCHESGMQITMKPLIAIEELKVDNGVSPRDIKAMELALITLYQPICNVEGIYTNYNMRGK